jgi:hypothetical protein
MEVFQVLKNNSKLCEEKSKQYGNTYYKFGTVMIALHPDGINLKTEKDFQVYGVYLMIIHKLTRISQNIFSGEKMNIDSITDLSVYAAMLEKVVTEWEKNIR